MGLFIYSLLALRVIAHNNEWVGLREGETDQERGSDKEGEKVRRGEIRAKSDLLT